MAAAPLDIIVQMIVLLLQSTLNNMAALFGLFLQLIGSLSLLLGEGMLGIFLAFSVFAVVAFFISKFFFGSIKVVAILIAAGFLILLFFLFGYYQALA